MQNYSRNDQERKHVGYILKYETVFDNLEITTSNNWISKDKKKKERKKERKRINNI